MKYIKTFNESLNTHKEMDNIIDIFQDFIDDNNIQEYPYPQGTRMHNCEYINNGDFVSYSGMIVVNNHEGITTPTDFEFSDRCQALSVYNCKHVNVTCNKKKVAEGARFAIVVPNGIKTMNKSIEDRIKMLVRRYEFLYDHVEFVKSKEPYDRFSAARPMLPYMRYTICIGLTCQ